MNRLIAQQVALDDALVAPEDRVVIGKCNRRINLTKTQKEAIYQVGLDTLTLSPCYNAFLITDDVPEIYMHQVPNQEFVEPHSHDEIVTFIKSLGYKGPLESVPDLAVNPKKARKRTKATVTPKKKSSFTTDDNIIPDLDVALELGKSISKIKVEEHEEARKIHETHERIITAKPTSDEESDAQSQKLKGMEMLSDDALLEVEIRKAIKASRRDYMFQQETSGSSEGVGITPKVPDVTKAIFGVQDITDEDWGSDDDIVLSSDDERIESEKETTKSGKTNENSDDEEEHVKEEYEHEADNVHDDVEKQGDVNVEMKDDEIAAESKVDEEMDDAAQANAEKIDKEKGDTEQDVNDQVVKDAQVKDDDHATTIVPVIQKEKPDVPPSNFSLSILSDYVIPEHSIPTPTPAQQVLIVTPFTSNIQQSTPIPTPPKTSEAPAITTTSHDPLPVVIQRLSNLETKFEVSDFVTPSIESKVRDMLQEYTINPKQHGSQKDVLEIQKIKLEHATKKQLPKHSAKPFDQAAKAEFDQKEILFKMMRDSKSYEKHLTHQALYDALMLSIILGEDYMERAKAAEPPTQKKRRHDDKDQDPSARSDQEMKKSKKSKDIKPSKKTKQAGSSKDTTQSQPKSTGKSMQAEETVFEAVDTNLLMDQGENIGNADEQPNDEVAPKTNKSRWFKQPPRPPTPDPEWNKGKSVKDGPVQNWLNDLANAEKPPLSFDELMSTPIDFTAFAMNRLKLTKLTKANVVGPVYNLLKGTCKSCIELEYNMEECYHALSDKLDWNNLEGDRCPYDFTKPLPLHGSSGDFPRLHLNDIENMLLLHVQNKLFNLEGDVIVDLAVALRMECFRKPQHLRTPPSETAYALHKVEHKIKRSMKVPVVSNTIADILRNEYSWRKYRHEPIKGSHPRACPHHGFSELHQLDTFYNALNTNDQDSLNSAAGGNFLDKMPRECLKIIESKSKVRNSRSKPVVAKVSASTSTSGISPDVSELKDMVKALLLDKQNQSQAPAHQTPARNLKRQFEQSCETCGVCILTKSVSATDGNIYRDNIQEYVSQAAAVNYNQGNASYRPQMVANQIRPPGFPPMQNHQNNQNRGINFNQNRGNNFNQNRGNNFNQGQVYQPQINQPPTFQAQAPVPPAPGVSKPDFYNYVRAK
ncbi:hypothetical protein Tco_1448331 [Tanacetum coccineum]